jgi:isopentenyldiphosphate isomerase
VKQSQQQTIAKYTELAKMFPDIRDSVISVYPSDSNYIIVEFISKGSMPSNTFELPICTILPYKMEKSQRISLIITTNEIADLRWLISD